MKEFGIGLLIQRAESFTVMDGNTQCSTAFDVVAKEMNCLCRGYRNMKLPS